MDVNGGLERSEVQGLIDQGEELHKRWKKYRACAIKRRKEREGKGKEANKLGESQEGE